MANEKSKNIHAGHRQRVKERFDKEGLGAFADHAVLEFLLFYAIPQRDTNELAHTLLANFGSLSGVFDAKDYELERFVGKNAARLIKLILPISKRYYIDRENFSKILSTTKEVGAYARNYFVGDNEEKIILMSFDSKMKLLNVSQIAEGSVNSCEIDYRLLCEVALRNNASIVALAHNHPGGIALPSPEDVSATKYLAELLENLQITLFDHIIVGNRDFVSMRDSGIIR